MSFSENHAIVTGGANGIGCCIAEHFINAGAHVTVIDIDKQAGEALCSQYSNMHFIHGDIAERNVLEALVKELPSPANYVINNACITRKGLLSGCSWDDFEYVQRVGVTAPYYLTSMLHHSGLLAQGASVVNIASTRGLQSQGDTESYTAAKGGILALTHALSISLAGKARVNAVSPGWIDTTCSEHSEEDKSQHPAKRIGRPEDIAEMVLFLCDNHRAGFITGENILIDGGMSKLMVYHNDDGWKYS